jgi:hypothetical protein
MGRTSQNTPPQIPRPPRFPPLYLSPAFALLTPLRRKTQTRSTRKDSTRRRAGRIDPPNPPRRRRKGPLSGRVTSSPGMVTAWERARRALATRVCMRFPSRHAAVEDVPRALDAVEEPFPVAEPEEEEEQQQQGEREKSLGAASPAPASARRSSRSGSRSPAVRSLSPLVAALRFCLCPWCMGCANSFMILRRVSPCSCRRYGLLGTGIAVVWKLVRNSLKRNCVSKLEQWKYPGFSFQFFYFSRLTFTLPIYL